MSYILDHTFVPSQGNFPTIYTSKMSHVGTALVCIRVSVGSRYETPKEHGLTHFLEHMAFKGTKRRSSLDITRDIEEAGGSLNAATSHESTTYYANVLSGAVDLGLDILSDIVLNSTFPQEEIEKERRVIVQEILEGEDTPYDVLMEALMATSYAHQPLGNSITGTQKSVSKLSRKQLCDYKERSYICPHFVVSCVGDIKHETFIKLVENAFDAPPGVKRQEGPKSRFSSGFIFQKKPIAQTHIALAYEGYSYKDKRRYLMTLFQIILGGSMTSRLFQACRERLGLCYSIHASSWHFSDTGLLVIASSTDEERAPLLIKTIQEEIVRFCEDMTQRELERAKALMRYSLSSVGESKSARDQWIMHYLSCEPSPSTSWLAPSPFSIMEMIGDVSKEELLVAMENVFSKNPAIAVVGAKNPLKGSALINRVMMEESRRKMRENR